MSFLFSLILKIIQKREVEEENKLRGREVVMVVVGAHSQKETGILKIFEFWGLPYC